jgi:hypothetical protein
MKTKTLIPIILLGVLLVACAQSTSEPTEIPAPAAMIAFRVTLPAPPNPGEAVMLTVVDEITGLAFNPKDYPLQAEDAQHYTVILPFRVGSTIRYHYTRQNGIVLQEHLSDGRAVRYRMYRVDGPGTVNDVVGRWTDTPFTWLSGRISGQVTDTVTGRPVPNLLVTAGGAQAFTSSDGSYLIEGLPPGTHNLVAYALDGTYHTYQQGATVEAGSMTPATFAVTPAALVNVTFTVNVPTNTPPDAPLRFAGSLVQLGNSFADLTGGGSSVATRMPPLVRLSDGKYTITLTLPVGADVQYKYTIGDGYWSSEHAGDGGYLIRQIIVPEEDTAIEETVDTWQVGNLEPITFTVNIPASTPSMEGISIQFNPGYSWMEPIPMWPIAENRWEFVLTSPLDGLETIIYRYCREGQCGSADDLQTMGNSTEGAPASRVVNPDLYGSTIDDTVQSWAWTFPIESATVPNVTIQPRGPGFVTGVEFQNGYHPSWGPLWTKAIADVQQSGANWLVLTPSWSFTRLAPPVLELVPGRDVLWAEQANTILQARDSGLTMVLFPTPNFPTISTLWWEPAPRDFSWWVSWFDHYRDFLLHYADMAERTGVQTLILGGDWLAPALPGGTLEDGTSSKVPADADARWREIIRQVRTRFKGTILWALPYPQDLHEPISFIDAVDGVYLMWSAPLAKTGDPTQEAGKILDTDVLPFQEQIGKPVLLGLTYSSASGSLSGCITNADGACIDPAELIPTNPDIPSVQINMQEQAEAYNAMLLAVNDRLWVSGVITRGFYPPVVLQDKSNSVRGKLAAGVLWYWFPKLLGK